MPACRPTQLPSHACQHTCSRGACTNQYPPTTTTKCHSPPLSVTHPPPPSVTHPPPLISYHPPNFTRHHVAPTHLHPPLYPPPTPTLFSVSTPQSFAQALLSLIPAYILANPLARFEAQYVLPASLILNQNVTAEDVVDLAVGSTALNGSGNGSGSGSRRGLPLPLPLLMTGPTFPMQLGLAVPSIVALSLAGCVGCLALTDSTVHVYLTQMMLTGRTGVVGGECGWWTGGGCGCRLLIILDSPGPPHSLSLLAHSCLNPLTHSLLAHSRLTPSLILTPCSFLTHSLHTFSLLAHS